MVDLNKGSHESCKKLTKNIGVTEIQTDTLTEPLVSDIAF